MQTVSAIAGVLLLAILSVDVFETLVLPRRVAGRFRLTAVFYLLSWRPWAALARRIASKKKREAFLSVYGPLSFLVLLGFWASVLVFSFALLRWSARADVTPAGDPVNFGTEMYISGTFFAGIGEPAQRGPAAQALSLWEAMSGFALLALVIGYLPVLYQSFSRRESNITLLDARAGSPPSASELMRRYAGSQTPEALLSLLRDWEHWAAELLESHISYPVLGFFRSQHDNQSWLGSMTTILDSCALIMAGVDRIPTLQAELTFAMARHAIVDLAKVFNVPPDLKCCDRLTSDELQRLRAMLADANVRLHDDAGTERRLGELRRLYEPYVQALSSRLLMDLPKWVGEPRHNWEVSKWERTRNAALH